MARKKRNTTVSNWLDGAQEIPREGVAVNKDRSSRQKFYRRMITASVVLLPISLGVNVLSLGATTANEPVAVISSSVASEGKAAAILAVEKWLASDRSPLPGSGRLISWDGFDVVEKPKQTEEQARQNPLPAFDMEVHHFTLIDGYGTTYRSDVQVAVDPTSGAHVLGTPSLVPIALPTDGGATSGAGPWFGFGQTAAPAPVQSAVQAWARDFTSGDPDALRLAVQDDNEKHSYVPLYNVATYTVNATYSAFVPEPGADPAKAVTSSSTMLLRVEFDIQWVGAPPLATGEKPAPITYDLLVKNVGGGAPYVAAWGGPGAGPELKEHGNALVDRVIVKAKGPSAEKAESNHG